MGRMPVIIPRPMKMEGKKGFFTFTSATRIVAEPGLAAAAEFLASRLRPATGFPLPIEKGGVGNAPSGCVLLSGSRDGGWNPGDEGYELETGPEGIALRASAAAGAFYGAQTIRQLLPLEIEKTKRVRGVAWKVPSGSISDAPRYPWRGLLLDSCRHFMTKKFVKRYIDLLAYHKLNRLHWHLTEDQGWRLEVDKYPELTQIGAWREGKGGKYGGFYTKADVREIVEYAAGRHVMVVPEIEMPGHCQSALAAYPELSCTGGPFKVGTEWGVYKDVYCAGNDAVFGFLENVLSEVLELFPAPYVHIGADEVPKDRWKACPKCQERIRNEGLRDEFALQTYFVARIAKFIQARGKKVICWDEVLEGGAPPGVIVQAWRGHEPGARAVEAGSEVIVSPYTHVYLDYGVDYNGLRKVLSFDPVPAGLSPEGSAHIIGTEGLIWTEGAPQHTVDSKVFPRLGGVAEVAWSPVLGKDWPEFSARSRAHCERLRLMGVDVGPADEAERRARERKKPSRRRKSSKRGRRRG